METKTLAVPFVEGCSALDFDRLRPLLLSRGASARIDSCLWKDYPYVPETVFNICRDDNGLCLLFRVEGLDLRGVELQDGGHTWEDSCCEFFLQPSAGGPYYNFELNCIGTLLVARGTGRSDREALDPAVVASVERWSSLPHETVEREGGVERWSVALKVPFSLVGLDGDNLPESVGANFYKCGDLTAHPHFATWNPVGTPAPDFHVPQYFGSLILV